MPITLPPEMLPIADGPADVIVVNEDGTMTLVHPASQSKQ